jgi:hypothetical protein
MDSAWMSSAEPGKNLEAKKQFLIPCVISNCTQGLKEKRLGFAEYSERKRKAVLSFPTNLRCFSNSKLVWGS